MTNTKSFLYSDEELLKLKEMYKWPAWVKQGSLFKPDKFQDRWLGIILEVETWDHFHGTTPCFRHMWIIDNGRSGFNQLYWKSIFNIGEYLNV